LEEFCAAGLAAEIVSLAVALGAECCRFIHVHSANRVFRHGCFYFVCRKLFKQGKGKSRLPGVEDGFLDESFGTIPDG
jgi:hypothetical protein